MPAEKPPDEQPDSLPFQAEVQQLLHILAHSLYTDKEIFLRELISNASDALHRIQFEMLTNRGVLDPEAELAIRVSFDPEAHTLTITDTGIGMTREEAIENLGTIAHSGARAFIQRLSEGQQPGDIIGQFGVGFYSVFMVAEEVTVTSRSYLPEAQAIAWTSRGENAYTLAAAEKSSRGTEVKIHLKDEATEFASAWRLEGIIKKHSNFIPFPIYLGENTVNLQTALWRQSPQEVAAEDYDSFYRQLTLDTEAPLLHAHMVTDVPVDIRALLFAPRKLERTVLDLRTDHGLRLYTRNVLIQEASRDLLPTHLRFVEGVVDSEDLPLNISRESVQRDPVLRRIQKALAGRVLKALKELAGKGGEEYAQFWESFGVLIKEGIASNPFDHDDLLPLLRFYSSRSAGELTTLPDYIERMAPEQNTIYYVLGEDRETVAYSPHLDYFKAHDLEVLYLSDPLDPFLVQSLREFDGKALQNIDDASLDLPETETQAPEEAAAGAQENLDRLLERFQAVLGDRVTDVRLSRRLTDHPCRLVSPEATPDRELAHIRRMLDGEAELAPKILEINPNHPLVLNLAALNQDAPEDSRIEAVIEQLFDNMLLLEGLLPNPARMVERLQALLESATRRTG